MEFFPNLILYMVPNAKPDPWGGTAFPIVSARLRFCLLEPNTSMTFFKQMKIAFTPSGQKNFTLGRSVFLVVFWLRLLRCRWANLRVALASTDLTFSVNVNFRNTKFDRCLDLVIRIPEPQLHTIGKPGELLSRISSRVKDSRPSQFAG